MREALQRIAQTGVVEVRHGGTTTVRDFHRYAGLDLLPRLMVRGQKLDVAIARSVVEARTQIAPGIAALAAERGGPAVTAPLGEILDRLSTTTDAVQWQREVLEFWDVIVDSSDSLAYRLMFNSLRSAYEPAVPILAAWLEAEVGLLDPYRVLATAIAAGDPGTARAAAERVLAPTARALMSALDAAGEEAR